MKKILSIILVLVMLFSLSAPVGALYETTEMSPIPFVRICGDGEPLVDGSGKPILNYKGLLNGGDDDGDNGEIIESVMNVIVPFLIDGLATDNWDPYYDALYKEISELFENSLLDENGEPEPGSGTTPQHHASTERQLSRDWANKNGEYGQWSYQFFYDWRLDPFVTADKLNVYIKKVKEVTGHEKVALVGSCIGTASVLAYLQKYGTDDVALFGFQFGTAGGAEILSNAISGNFNIDSGALDRFLKDCEAIGLFSLEEFLTSTIDLVLKAGVVDGITTAIKETLYEKLVEGVTSALALSTFYTFPSYWSTIETKDFETAKNYVFGPEGSEKRIKYAGLIEKIDNYDVKVRQQIPALLKQIEEESNVAVTAKYGLQIAPICKDPYAIGDQFSSLTNASFGATTSKIYNTLSDDYIAARVAEGKGKYISPDKQVDASTCAFPDSTWIIKGASHSLYSDSEHKIFGTAAACAAKDVQLTVDDLALTQYIVYSYETNSGSPMTEENCNSYNWKVKEESKEEDRPRTLMEFLTALFNWFTALIKKFF